MQQPAAGIVEPDAPMGAGAQDVRLADLADMHLRHGVVVSLETAGFRQRVLGARRCREKQDGAEDRNGYRIHSVFRFHGSLRFCLPPDRVWPP